jgi:hypothetical protein
VEVLSIIEHLQDVFLRDPRYDIKAKTLYPAR